MATWQCAPAIPGCHAEGETIAEALQELEAVARTLLDLRSEDGLPLPEGLRQVEPGGVEIRAEMLLTLG